MTTPTRTEDAMAETPAHTPGKAAAMVGLASLVFLETMSCEWFNRQREHGGWAAGYDGTEKPTDAERALRELLAETGMLPILARPEAAPASKPA